MLHKAFANNSSANIKLPKTQLSKIVQSRGFLVEFSDFGSASAEGALRAGVEVELRKNTNIG